MNIYFSDFEIEYSPTAKRVASPESQLTFTYKINKSWDINAGMRYWRCFYEKV